ncbi:MAG: TetR/AcrR family transcriptional regulator [Acidobacteria bacterium]|nr:TetR/AcrR family transcriptional regulator [Acidobacteriota bacterium]MBK8146959.1 TetR/AcrR family transcriptional regulator [Acidobacteriota bacterium]MBK8812489.1 TetR/AcrR family transcriptional regulator [Acidobacteriota bacterium]
MNRTSHSKAAVRRTPKGRDAVRKSILDATEKLLLKRGPSEISIREIAHAAKVKHPLIYRHFGSKNALIMAVHSRELGNVAEIVSKIEKLEGNILPMFETFEKDRWRQVALARAMIDGVDPRLLQNMFPVMQHLVELLKKRLSESDRETRHEPEVLAFAMGGMAMGWVLFQPFLMAATGLDGKSPEEMKELAVEMLEEFVQKVC